MKRRYPYVRSLFILAAIILMSTLAACGDVKALANYLSDNESGSAYTTSIDPTFTSVYTFTAMPSDTPTEIPPSPTPEPTLHPCRIKLFPADGYYHNPQENLDPSTGTTWMAIRVEEDLLWLLFGDYVFHYWWDTRAFEKIDSFNVGDGPCEVLIEEHMIRCEGIPLRGTNYLPTGGYEYGLSIYIQDLGCKFGPIYQQTGLVFMDTGEHDVFLVNGEDAP